MSEYNLGRVVGKGIKDISVNNNHLTVVYTDGNFNVFNLSGAVDDGNILLSLYCNDTNVYTGEDFLLTGVISGVTENTEIKLYCNDELYDTLSCDDKGYYSTSITLTTEGVYTFYTKYEYENILSNIISVNVGRTETSSTGIVLTLSSNVSRANVGETIVLTGSILLNNTGVSGLLLDLYEDDQYKGSYTSDARGSVKLNYSIGSGGTHTYYLIFNGNANYYPNMSNTVYISSNKNNATLNLNVEQNTVTIGDAPSFTGFLSVGNNKTVKLYCDNVLKSTTVTSSFNNRDGYFTFLTTTTDSVGEHDYFVRYDGDDSYNSVDSNHVSITVKNISNASTLVLEQSDTNRLSAGLLNAEEEPISNATIVFKEYTSGFQYHMSNEDDINDDISYFVDTNVTFKITPVSQVLNIFDSDYYNISSVDVSMFQDQELILQYNKNTHRLTLSDGEYDYSTSIFSHSQDNESVNDYSDNFLGDDILIGMDNFNDLSAFTGIIPNPKYYQQEGVTDDSGIASVNIEEVDTGEYECIAEFENIISNTITYHND